MHAAVFPYDKLSASRLHAVAAQEEIKKKRTAGRTGRTGAYHSCGDAHDQDDQLLRKWETGAEKLHDSGAGPISSAVFA
jgi:hypothetical protein